MRRCERDEYTRARVHFEILQRRMQGDALLVEFEEAERYTVLRLGLVDGGRGNPLGVYTWGARRSAFRELWQEPDVLKRREMLLNSYKEKGTIDRDNVVFGDVLEWLEAPPLRLPV